MILPETRCDQGTPGFALDGSEPSPVARAIVQGLAPARG